MSTSRLRFAVGYALRHLIISALLALLVAALVFKLLYPYPYAVMLGVGVIFALLLAVDVVCGPLLTLVLASPKKSTRERWVDFTLVGVVQLAALLYGVHSLWLARPAILAFEEDRLVVVSANEVDPASLGKAPPGLRELPWFGQLQVTTRKPRDSGEIFSSIEKSLAGVSLAQRPDWWLPWQHGVVGISERAKPASALLARRPESALVLQKAISDTGMRVDDLYYLPFTSRKNKEWIVLLDTQMSVVGYVQVDGF